MVHRKGIGDLLKRVNHVAIVVSDLNRSVAFYEGVLGLRRIRRPHIDRHDGAWLTFGNIELHLIQGIPLPQASEDPNLIVPHLSLETTNVGETMQALREMGVPLKKMVLKLEEDHGALDHYDSEGNESSCSCEPAELVQIFIRDPDGHYIELCNCDELINFCFTTT